MTFGSRQKGSRAERQVAGLLQDWWRALDPDCQITRTPLSGGWGAPALRAGFRASGDLLVTSLSFPWCVEIKAREGWAWSTLLKGRPSPVWGWWRQAQDAAREQGLKPLLIFKKNREPWWAMADTFGGVPLRHVVTWDESALADVDYGYVHPRVTELSRLLANSPQSFAVLNA